MSTIDALSRALDISEHIWTERRDEQNSPDSKRVARLFSIHEASRLIGRSPSSLRKLEREGAVESPSRDARNHRVYSLQDIDRHRRAFGINAGREEGDNCCICAVIAYKGGAGKTTTATSLAHHLTMKGKKVLLIDCDPQASSSAFFGYIPDHEFEADETIYRVLVRDDRDGKRNHIDPADMRKIIRPTHWGQLDLVPASLDLYAAEYMMPAEMRDQALAAAESGSDPADTSLITSRLLDAINTVESDYDVVILDAPPSIGLISMALVNAADALICPIQPSVVDYASTQSFMTMVIGLLERFSHKEDLSFVRVLINNYSKHEGTDEVVNMIRATYGSFVLNNTLPATQEIKNASRYLKTVFELERPIGSPRTFNRAYQNLMDTFDEIEDLIEQTWPSRCNEVSP